ncbi:MAG: HAD family phosphatase [Candidatus Omnitrophota bacterium]|nr:HAD family phosphatase [Candidatus Omnitrophota bacterium]
MVKAIIFDLGNVLIDFDHTIAAKRISAFCDKSAEEIFALFFDSELTGLFEEGKISPQDFFLKVKEMLNLKLEYDTFAPIWSEIFFLTKKNRCVYNLVQRLKEHYKVALLTNINSLHFDYLKKNFPVFDAFHHIIASYEVGLRKPHPLIYQKTLELLNVLAQDAFYTDDRAELIEKAKDLGIKSFHFQNTEKLKEDFLSVDIHWD